MPDRNVTVAVVQATPAMLNRAECLEKIREKLEQATQAGATLAVFPEAFIPGYPRGFGFGATIGNRTFEGRDLFRSLTEESIEIPGPEVDAIAMYCRELNIYCCIGVIERSGGTLYCTMLIIDSDGDLIQHHRKLKPTASEKIIWGEGDGSSLHVIDTPFAKIGGLICWENYMPLARVALYGQGIEIYLAPTADSRDTWQATLRHIACEGRCFVIGCNQFALKSDYPAQWKSQPEFATLGDIVCRGGSAVYSPLGELIAGPVYDREEMLIAKLDLDDIARSKLDFDAVGHYSRPDIFQLLVNRQPQATVTYTDPSPLAGSAQ